MLRIQRIPHRPQRRAPERLKDLHPWAPIYGLDRCVNPRCTTPHAKHHTHGLCNTCHQRYVRAEKDRKMGRAKRVAAYRERKRERRRWREAHEDLIKHLKQRELEEGTPPSRP